MEFTSSQLLLYISITIIQPEGGFLDRVKLLPVWAPVGAELDVLVLGGLVRFIKT